MAATPARLGAGFAIYVALGGVLLVFGILSGFSIGLFILPVPIVMFLALPFWGRWHVVAGVVAAAAAGSLAFLGTTPLTCYERSFGSPRSGCTRWWLPDIAGLDTAAAKALAIRAAVGSAIAVGLVVAFAVWVVVTARRRRTSVTDSSEIA